MLYNEDFVSQTALELRERFESPIPFAEYAVDIDGGPGNVDILDLMEYLQDSDNSRKLDPLVRQSVSGKNVSFKLDGEDIGSMRMNDVLNPWSAFPIFNEHPKAYLALANVIGSHLLKKSTPPLTKLADKLAAVAAQKTS